MSAYRANRQRMHSRRCAVQALYQWQLAGHSPAAIFDEFVAERELTNADLDYFKELTTAVPREASALQAMIEPLIDRVWSQLDPVERAVLLIAAYELEHHIEIPWRVVINEAVELAKMFGAQDGYRYVNGVVDRLAASVRSVEIGAARRPSAVDPDAIDG